MKNTIINTLLFIWQLPQNIIGLILLLFSNTSYYVHYVKYENGKYFISNNKIGVSLGMFVFFTDKEYSKDHEYGHSIQSQILGWFYLLIVGIPSFIRACFFVLKANNIPYSELYNLTKWYYKGYPEKWADRLGNVERY